MLPRSAWTSLLALVNLENTFRGTLVEACRFCVLTLQYEECHILQAPKCLRQDSLRLRNRRMHGSLITETVVAVRNTYVVVLTMKPRCYHLHVNACILPFAPHENSQTNIAYSIRFMLLLYTKLTWITGSSQTSPGE